MDSCFCLPKKKKNHAIGEALRITSYTPTLSMSLSDKHHTPNSLNLDEILSRLGSCHSPTTDPVRQLEILHDFWVRDERS